MMLGSSFAQTSPATEGGCRRQNSDGIKLEKELKKAELFRRRRMKYRRIKLLSEGTPLTKSSSGDDVSRPMKKVKSHQRERGDAVTCESHGSISVIGRRRDMEDYVTVRQGFLNSNNGGEKYDFFGVYDGHGGWGVSRGCSERLHELVAEVAAVEYAGGGGGPGLDWEKVMVEGFRRMDEEVNESGGKTVEMMGSTAVVAVVGSEEVVVANCGDSRAVMGRRGTEAVQLTDDHKPERPDELERIEEAGGKVINWNGQRVQGVLAISRSIGDRHLKPFVTTEPEVKAMKRSEEDEFLILASDGLWDVISNDIACRVVRRCLDKQPNSSFRSCNKNMDEEEEECGGCTEAAVALTELAMARGSRDNISIIVVDLRNKRL